MVLRPTHRRGLRTLLLVVLLVPWLACEGRGPARSNASKHASAADKEATDEASVELPALERGTAAGLEYVEFVTGGANKNATLPLIVAIHGLGDEPDQFAGLLAGFPRPARIVLPRAPDPYEGGGWSWFPIRARDENVDGLAQGVAAAAERIAAAINDIQRRRPTKGKAIVTGFSQGGMLSFALAVRHADVVDAAVPVGGWLPPPLWPTGAGKQAPSIVALHGRADPAVRFEPTEQAVEHLRRVGYDVRLRAYDGVQHVITPAMRKDMFDALEGFLPGTPRTSR